MLCRPLLSFVIGSTKVKLETSPIRQTVSAIPTILSLSPRERSRPCPSPQPLPTATAYLTPTVDRWISVNSGGEEGGAQNIVFMS